MPKSKTKLNPGQRRSLPIEGLAEEEVQQIRAIVQGFLEWRGDNTPLQKANRIIACAIDAKKYDERTDKYSEWFNAPGLPRDDPKATLFKRITVLCGRGFKQYMNLPTTSKDPQNLPTKKRQGDRKTKDISALTEGELGELHRSRKQYIKEFNFKSKADLVLLDRLLYHEVIARRYEEEMLKVDGNAAARSAQSLKHITDSIRNLQKELGITALQRNQEKDQNIHGSVADFIARGRRAMEENPHLQEKWLKEELEMLIRKYERFDEMGNREITSAAFMRSSGGVPVSEAYKILKRTPPE